MVFTNNDLHVIRHHLETRFRPLNMVIRFRFPVMNGIRCATKPSGTILIVSTLPIGRVWLVSADEGFSLDDVILPKWQNCLHGEDGHIEPLPDTITTIDEVVEWVASIVEQSGSAA